MLLEDIAKSLENNTTIHKIIRYTKTVDQAKVVLFLLDIL